MELTPHSYLSEIKAYKPGKAETEKGNKVIKLSSNENALGSSPKAISSYANHGKDIFRYANGSCAMLREAIAKNNNIDADKIVCGAGSDEILALLATAFAGPNDEIIYSEHGFLMYPISAKRVGAVPVKVKEKGLKTDINAIISAITNKTKIIFIANPNNPTGSYLNDKEIAELIDRTPKNILIVLDHAYEEFVTKKDYPNAIKLVNENNNVVVTRTFSKVYGLASLRIGWCYSSSKISEVLNKIRGPFNVGGPAQIAAISALEDKEFLQKSIEHNEKWLKILSEEFSTIRNIKVHPSIANFILIEFPDAKICQNVNQLLLENGIIVREMQSYGLPNCLRITIGTEEENLQVIKDLKEILNS